MSSVLGKRVRAPACPAESTGVQTRSKRRLVAVLGNEENNNPFITRTSPIVPVKEKKASSVQTRPAKHGSAQSRVSTTTPNSKINALFPVTKSATPVKVFKDVKPSPVSTPQTPRHRDALSKKIAVTPRHRVQLTKSPATPRSASTPSNAAANVYNQARQLFARCTDPGVLIGREDERGQLSMFITKCLDSDKGGCLYISGPPGTGKSAFVEGVCHEFVSTEKVSMTTVNCMSIKSAKDLATTLCHDLDMVYDTARGADFDFLRLQFLSEETQAKKNVVVLDEIDRLVDLDLKLLYSLFEWSMLPTSNLILVGIANALDLTDRFLPRLKSRSLKPTLLPFMPYTAPQIATILTSKLQSLAPNPSIPGFVPFLHPAAIQFVSKKVASQTGDLRKAFDIAHRTIALAESEAKASVARLRLEQSSPSKTPASAPLRENINLASPPAAASAAPTPLKQTTLTSSLAHLTIETAPRATIAHAAKITAQVFSNGATQRLSHLNIQQKAVLCSLSAIENKRRTSLLNKDSSQSKIFATPSKKKDGESAAPTIRHLFETYTTLCRRENLLHPLTSTEFRDVVSGLETLSLIQEVTQFSSISAPLTPSRTPRRSKKTTGGFLFSSFSSTSSSNSSSSSGGCGADDRRMATCVSFQEVAAAVQSGPGNEILREILEG